MRRYALICLVVFLATSIVGCGARDQTSIVKDLSERSSEMASYSSHGKLTIKSDHGSQQYDVEVWYKKPDFYRVRLKNKNRGLTQILLRNEQGVFVLTPHLKRSFRFQSNWPTKNSQIYLYQTVLSSILGDQKRKFTAGKKEYQFEVAAKYSFNPTLKTQQIMLDTKLNPKKIAVLNDKKEAIIKMEFDRFEENASFDKDSFELQYNMDSLKAQETFSTLTNESRGNAKEVLAVTPGFIPAGCTLTDENEIKSVNGTSIIMRFLGKRSFTLTQRLEETLETTLAVKGEPVDLGETLAVFADQGKMKRLAWIQNGREFEILGNLSKQELINIATSTFAQPAK